MNVPREVRVEAVEVAVVGVVKRTSASVLESGQIHNVCVCVCARGFEAFESSQPGLLHTKSDRCELIAEVLTSDVGGVEIRLDRHANPTAHDAIAVTPVIAMHSNKQVRHEFHIWGRCGGGGVPAKARLHARDA